MTYTSPHRELWLPILAELLGCPVAEITLTEGSDTPALRAADMHARIDGFVHWGNRVEFLGVRCLPDQGYTTWTANAEEARKGREAHGNALRPMWTFIAYHDEGRITAAALIRDEDLLPLYTQPVRAYLPRRNKSGELFWWISWSETPSARVWRALVEVT